MILIVSGVLNFIAPKKNTKKDFDYGAFWQGVILGKHFWKD